MNWIQRLFCSKSSKIIEQLEGENAKRYDLIKQLQADNAQLKRGILPSDFKFDNTQVKTISGDKLRTILKEAFPGKEIMLNDGNFKYTTLAEVQRWSSFDPTSELKYRADELDCDKFALTDMANFKSENNYQLGNAVFGIGRGYAPVGYHEWNIAYVEEGIIMLEPQNDKIWKWDDNKDYNPDFIYI